ncbi:hypothetical protein [Streptomyces sp. NPDC087212]|uniref:hypothetical protein n=1 Tax=Streptomyces sp. NPDC087212 TaxID=3365766 RepID=UPI00382061E2
MRTRALTALLALGIGMAVSLGAATTATAAPLDGGVTPQQCRDGGGMPIQDFPQSGYCLGGEYARQPLDLD